MRVFVAGASGAIGQPLIAELLKQGRLLFGPIREDGVARLPHTSLDTCGCDTSFGFRKQVAVFISDLHLVFPHKAVFRVI